MREDDHLIFEAFKGKLQENAEEPHGYPQGMTAIQNLMLNELKKHGFKLTKISHADKERDAYPTVFMKRNVGPMHNVVEIDGMGSINGEHYKDYLAGLKSSEDAESVESIMTQQIPGQFANQAGAAVNTIAGQMNITPMQQAAIQNLLTAFNVPTGSNIGKTVENLILKMVQKPR